MTPLARVAWGFVVVVADLRIDGVDLVPDLVGWGVVIWGLAPLVSRDTWFGAAMAAAVVGVPLSVPQLAAEPGPVLVAVQSVAETVLVFATCTAIMRVVDQPRLRTIAGRIRWVDLALAGAATVLALVADGPTEVAGGAAVAIVLLTVASLGVMVWFLVFLLAVSRHPAVGAGSRTAV